jgi:hypothetical protein
VVVALAASVDEASASASSRCPRHPKPPFTASVAAPVIACVAGWAVSDTQARAAVAPMDPFTLMTSAKQLPTEHFADYAFVF